MEKKIANFILDNPEKILDLTVEQISSEINVAKSSIIRFSKNLGFSGFREFKVNLAKYSTVRKNLIFENISSNDTEDSIIQKVFISNINTLENTYNILNTESFKSAVTALSNAEKIFFTGVGTSAPIANDAYYRFMRIGLPAVSITDPHINRISASMMNSNCVILGISHTGMTIETVETMKLAKKNGAVTICLTSFSNNAITEVSDIKLVISSTETVMMNEAISSRIAQLAVLDSLYACLAQRKQNKTLPLIENMNNVLKSLRY